MTLARSACVTRELVVSVNSSIEFLQMRIGMPERATAGWACGDHDSPQAIDRCRFWFPRSRFRLPGRGGACEAPDVPALPGSLDGAEIVALTHIGHRLGGGYAVEHRYTG